ncbi:MAG: glycine--tRNA ligase subunit beta, partial [Candidatus Margulisiibacteriota bacterium]
MNKSKINALLEIGCEEIPARFMPGLLADLKLKAEEKLKGNRLEFIAIETFGTPRRLALLIEGLPKKQPDIMEDMQGPPAEIAFGADNKPT